MAKTPEAKVKDRIHALLAEFHGCAVNYIGGQYANNGTSDILACVDGRFVAIEAKAGDNKPTALQVEYLERVEAAGGLALVINEKGLEYLRHCLENIHDQGLSNYRAFITPAVARALGQRAKETAGPTEKAPRIRTKTQPRMERL
ncbi:MAG: hypothetical protein WCZ20_05335 [Hydrogenophaga sp.]